MRAQYGWSCAGIMRTDFVDRTIHFGILRRKIMNSIEMLSPMKINMSLHLRHVLCGVLLLVAAVGRFRLWQQGEKSWSGTG